MNSLPLSVENIIMDYKKQFEETTEFTIIKTDGKIKKIIVSNMDDNRINKINELLNINDGWVTRNSRFSWKKNEKIDIYMNENTENLNENKLINYLLNKCDDEYNQEYKRWNGQIRLFGIVIISKRIFYCEGCSVELNSSPEHEMCEKCIIEFEDDESE